MIYFDNAATTFPKPKGVIKAINSAALNYGANPGRGGHTMAIKASEEIFKCRKNIADFFDVDDPEKIIFTLNCTHAINIVIKGLLKKGGHVVVSDLEHNAVMRPLTAMSELNVTYTAAKIYNNDDETLDSFRKAIKPDTKLVICTHVSNVWGIKQPIERLTAMCHQYGIPVMIDAAQSAGTHKIDVSENKYDFVCMPGHKGLYGPMGTGVLIANKPELLSSFIEGGTGSNSVNLEQPEIMPDKFESGTPNLLGISGLNAGVSFVKGIGSEKILSHEINLLSVLYERMSKNKNVIMYTERPDNRCGGVLAFNIKNIDSEQIAEYLNKKGGIAVRAGLHCAPAAHRHFNTENIGAVRVSPSYFNNMNEIYTLSKLIDYI